MRLAMPALGAEAETAAAHPVGPLAFALASHAAAATAASLAASATGARSLSSSLIRHVRVLVSSGSGHPGRARVRGTRDRDHSCGSCGQ